MQESILFQRLKHLNGKQPLNLSTFLRYETGKRSTAFYLVQNEIIAHIGNIATLAEVGKQLIQVDNTKDLRASRGFHVCSLLISPLQRIISKDK